MSDQEATTATHDVPRHIDPDEADERRQRAWDEQQRLHPPSSQARVEMLDRLQERARRLSVVARDLDTRAREARGDVQRMRSTFAARERDSIPRAYVPDPADVARLADMERTAERLAAEAKAMGPRAQAARQLADACERFLAPHKVGGPDDSRFVLRGGRS